MAGDAEKARTLYQQGLPMEKVAREAGFTSATTATAAVKRVLLKRGTITDPDLVRMAAMDRLDRLLEVAWPEAARGDLDSIKAVQDIEERRLRLLALAATSDSGPMMKAVDETLAALKLEPADAAACAAARRLAIQLDASATVLDPTVQTKAAYMMPHLINVLRELGATPAARASLKNAKGDESGKSAKLTALRGGGASAARA